MVSCPLSIASNTLVASLDRGLSWQYGPPVEQIIPLGGMVSQIVEHLFRTRSLSEYAKDGTLYASGNGFFDTQITLPRTLLESGFLFFSSHDNGQTWSAPNIVHTTLDWWLVVNTVIF